jgi:thioredoxin 1
MAEIRVATDANFEELVLKSERPVVVDFWAAWCGPCKMVAPEMEKLAAKYDGSVDVVKVDVDANPGLSQAFNILSIPTIAYFKPGKQPQGVVGFRPLEQLEQTFGLTEFATVSADRGTTDQHHRPPTPVGVSRGQSVVGPSRTRHVPGPMHDRRGRPAGG